ncbi:MAG: class I tRNA ligase family protein, partial [Gemmataceae bacterium]|nr:class I tRNA ligase family protein [Gemmataceae bacterium]
HCWRCKTELLYRLVDEWFIDMGPKGVDGPHGPEFPKDAKGSFRGDIAAVVQNVKFLPGSINGQSRELDWLKNMGPWMISKKRFWGLALPIWVSEDDPNDFEVIGSYQELKERAVEGWGEFDGHTPHRPFIDKVKIRNPRTGKLMSRVPDVGNPWLDAGIVAFSTLKYNADRAYWNNWYPADFITESFPGQFRNWFYALLAMSTMMSDGRPPFKTLFGFATMRDQEGKEMHKSDGNSIEFDKAADEGFVLTNVLKDNEKPALPDGALTYTETEVLDKDSGKPVKAIRAAYPPIGADVMRWLDVRHNPATNLNFGPKPANEVRSRVFFKLWNTYAMFCNYAIGDNFDPTAPLVPVEERPDVDRWLLSNLQSLITTAHKSYSQYSVMEFAVEAEKFIEGDLSNWYVRRNKDRLHSKNADLDATGLKDKRSAYQTLYATLTTLCKLLAPCVPFITEVMWRNLKTPADPESVHLCDFPQADTQLVDKSLSDDMEAVQRLISLGLSVRQSAKINVRQPLSELVVSAGADVDQRAVERFSDLILDELNVKAVRLHDKSAGPLLTAAARLNKKTAGNKLGVKLKQAEDALARLDATDLAARLERGSYELAGVMLEKGDFVFAYAASEGWCGEADRGTQVALNITITETLRLEGLARDVIRRVQDARKEAKLDLLDKIELHLSAVGDLARAINEHGQTIATAVQSTKWIADPLAGPGVHTTTANIGSFALGISFRVVS